MRKETEASLEDVRETSKQMLATGVPRLEIATRLRAETGLTQRTVDHYLNLFEAELIGEYRVRKAKAFLGTCEQRNQILRDLLLTALSGSCLMREERPGAEVLAGSEFSQMTGDPVADFRHRRAREKSGFDWGDHRHRAKKMLRDGYSPYQVARALQPELGGSVNSLRKHAALLLVEVETDLVLDPIQQKIEQLGRENAALWTALKAVLPEHVQLPWEEVREVSAPL